MPRWSVQTDDADMSAARLIELSDAMEQQIIEMGNAVAAVRNDRALQVGMGDVLADITTETVKYHTQLDAELNELAKKLQLTVQQYRDTDIGARNKVAGYGG